MDTLPLPFPAESPQELGVSQRETVFFLTSYVHDRIMCPFKYIYVNPVPDLFFVSL